MKRKLFNIAAAFSLLISIAAAVAWVVSYTGRPVWRLIATAHSADLTRVDSQSGRAIFATTPNFSNTPNFGFWDAAWVRNWSGRLTVLTQVIDYSGTLDRVDATPPSLSVEVSGQSVAIFSGVGDSSANNLGFELQSDSAGGPISARAWMLSLPYWFLVLVGLPLPALWLRLNRLRRPAGPS